jgi:hypothetical protein
MLAPAFVLGYTNQSWVVLGGSALPLTRKQCAHPAVPHTKLRSVRHVLLALLCAPVHTDAAAIW